MKLFTLRLGPIETNCYILTDPESGLTAVIDPGYPDIRLPEAIAAQGGTLVLILLTHGHFDHVGGVEMLRKEHPGCPVAINVADSDMLTDSKSNLSYYYGDSFAAQPAEIITTEGSIIAFGDKKFQVLHTPGHTPGSSVYIIDDLMFSGDTLFRGDVGRTDFPNGSEELLGLSLRRLRTLNPALKVYPGHGEPTTLAAELQTNPYLMRGTGG